jgi:Flp pilus assembly protein CpaB
MMDAVLPRTAAKIRRVDMRVAMGILLMFAAIVGGATLLKGAQSRTPVIVAARAVEPGDVITSEDLRVADVALEGHVESISAAEISRVTGKIAAEPLYSGKMLTSRSVAAGPPVPAGYVAMAIALNPEKAIGGSLGSGNRVALVATRNPGRPDASSVLLFDDVPVVSVSSRTGGEGQLVIVTLQLRPEDARALAEARNSGEIDLLLLSGESP